MDQSLAAHFLDIPEAELLDLLVSKEVAAKKIGVNWRISKQALLYFLEKSDK